MFALLTHDLPAFDLKIGHNQLGVLSFPFLRGKFHLREVEKREGLMLFGRDRLFAYLLTIACYMLRLSKVYTKHATSLYS